MGQDEDRMARLLVTTRAIDDPGDLLPHTDRFAPLAFIRRGDGVVGLGQAYTVSGGLARAADVWRWLSERAVVDDAVHQPGTGLVGLGSFPFAPDSEAGTLIVPAVIIGRRNGHSWITTVVSELGSGGDQPASTPIEPVPPIEFGPGTMTRDGYLAAVATVVSRIRAGELGKVVVAREVVARIGEGADLRHPLANLARDYPDAVTFAIDGLLGASPETLVRVHGGRVTARVLAGTTARGDDPTADDYRALALLGSRKDRDEHGLARSSVVAALRPHVTNLEAGEPFTLELPNLWHLATDLHGELTDGSSALDLVAALHPTAAVGGTPTDRAVAAIHEIEPFDRGRYAGPVGWIDGSGSGEWAIALRSAHVADGIVTAYAGAGIVADSVPEQELAETDLKLRPILGAFA